MPDAFTGTAIFRQVDGKVTCDRADDRVTASHRLIDLLLRNEVAEAETVVTFCTDPLVRYRVVGRSSRGDYQLERVD